VFEPRVQTPVFKPRVQTPVSKPRVQTPVYQPGSNTSIRTQYSNTRVRTQGSNTSMQAPGLKQRCLNPGSGAGDRARRTQGAGAEGRGRGRGRTRETRRAEARRNRGRVAGTRGNFLGHAARTSWTDLNKRHLFKGNSKTTESGREKRKTLLSRKKALTDLFQKIRQIASLKFPCHFQDFILHLSLGMDV